MKDMNEYDVVQNVALGSIALWIFSVEYYKRTEEKKGINLPILMLVLPLVLNESFTNSVYARNMKGGLFNSLNADSALFIGLQERMQDMSELSLKSLNLCFSSKLLYYHHMTHEIIPVRMGYTIINKYDSFKRITATSKRLGYWLATLEFDELCQLMKVRF
ncbi:DUF6521 family protein [Paenibacillus sp. LS1]|uniref:three component ABC system middle component n=1 Tax=Paenibacillus sp. LS1 TaxID=2992120 RepID=UPI00222F4905|nr:three component ABC system middle component [Paenibacillus sp. LS1]MCW3791090.1 DUF6521 family protein [Paenibacillus sp. LS1]